LILICHKEPLHQANPLYFTAAIDVSAVV